MIAGYKVMHDYFIGRNSGLFKSAINQLNNEVRVHA